jgi:aryl-alcohol dehydrogenase-like predicted oxidoreductase
LGTGGISETLSSEERLRLEEMMIATVRGGVNLIDTATIYGFGEAESIVGRVIRRLVGATGQKRSGLVICSKAGYFYRMDSASDKADFSMHPAAEVDVVRGCHCMHPTFLHHELDRSAGRLGVETIDVYLIHNPEEHLVSGADQFTRRLCLAFEFLERAVADGRIGAYGISTAEAFHTREPGPHALDAIVACAREVAGDQSNMKVVQIPFSLAKPGPLFERNHQIGDRAVSTFEAAAHFQLSVLTSVSINGGRVTRYLPDALREACPELQSDVQIALQFARSAPGVGASLVGLRRADHVLQALHLARIAPLDLAE